MNSNEEGFGSIDIGSKVFDGSLTIMKDGSIPAKKRATPTSSSMNFRNPRLSVVDHERGSPNRRSSMKKGEITPIEE